MSESCSILVLCHDMFFASQIEGTGQAVGVNVRVVEDLEAAQERLRTEKPDLMIVDLESISVDCQRLMDELPTPRPRVIGFFPHLRKERSEEAQRSGFDEVLTRGQFSARLTDILRQAK